MWHSPTNKAEISRETEATAALGAALVAEVQMAAEEENLDAWSDEVAADAVVLVSRGRCVEPEALTALQHELGTKGDVNCSLRKFVRRLQQIQGSITEEVQVLSRGVAAHSIGVTSATSLAELQHHLREIVNLSGPEVGCVWSTVKVGLGVTSVLSGNLVLGGFMIAFAAGSLGTSVLWKVHRDNQRMCTSMRERRTQSSFPVDGSTHIAEHIPPNPDQSAIGFRGTGPFVSDEKQGDHMHPQLYATNSDSGLASPRCDVSCEESADYDAWSG